jgi:hypothetical protein
MSQSLRQPPAVDARREWSDAELNELGEGLPIGEIARLLRHRDGKMRVDGNLGGTTTFNPNSGGKGRGPPAGTGDVGELSGTVTPHCQT